MRARTFQEVESVWTAVDGAKKLSDRVIGIGPFGVGLDGLLTWIPGVGGVYSVGAGIYLLGQAVRGHATTWTVVRMSAYLLVDAALTEATIVGSVVDFFFQGHRFAGRALQKDIETTHWIEMSEAEARASGLIDEHRAQARAKKLRRVVYLGR